jgi:hypothetical protein
LIERSDISRDAVRKTGKAFLFAGSVAASFLFLNHSHADGWRDWNWAMGYASNGWRWFLGSGLVLFGMSYLSYPLMKPIHMGWMVFALWWGWIMTRVVLSVFFFVVLTPIGLVLRLLGKDLIDKKVERGVPSYWKEKTRPLDSRSMERQF